MEKMLSSNINRDDFINSIYIIMGGGLEDNGRLDFEELGYYVFWREYVLGYWVLKKDGWGGR